MYLIYELYTVWGVDPADRRYGFEEDIKAWYVPRIPEPENEPLNETFTVTFPDSKTKMSHFFTQSLRP